MGDREDAIAVARTCMDREDARGRSPGPGRCGLRGGGCLRVEVEVGVGVGVGVEVLGGVGVGVVVGVGVGVGVAVGIRSALALGFAVGIAATVAAVAVTAVRPRFDRIPSVTPPATTTIPTTAAANAADRLCLPTADACDEIAPVVVAVRDPVSIVAAAGGSGRGGLGDTRRTRAETGNPPPPSNAAARDSSRSFAANENASRGRASGSFDSADITSAFRSTETAIRDASVGGTFSRCAFAMSRSVV